MQFIFIYTISLLSLENVILMWVRNKISTVNPLVQYFLLWEIYKKKSFNKAIRPIKWNYEIIISFIGHKRTFCFARVEAGVRTKAKSWNALSFTTHNTTVFVSSIGVRFLHLCGIARNQQCTWTEILNWNSFSAKLIEL